MWQKPTWQTIQCINKPEYKLKVKKVKTCIALHGISELRSVTCHMGSHSVTCHPTQVSATRLNPSHAGRYSIYLPRRDGRLSWPCYSETQPPGVELSTSRSRIQRPNHWATKQLHTTVTVRTASHVPTQVRIRIAHNDGSDIFTLKTR